jgi:hypothetical protein
MHPFHRVAPRVLLVAVGLLWTQVAMAEGLSIGVSGGSYPYEIKTSAQQLWSGKGNSITLSTDYGFSDGDYLGLSLTQVASGTVDFSFQGGPQSPYKFTRQDANLTWGTSFGWGGGGFLGVKSAETKIENTINTKFKTTGYFFGLAYPLSWGRNTLGFSLAWGVNSASWVDTGGELNDSALGFSGGVRYAYSVTPGLLLGVGFKAQRYEYLFTYPNNSTRDVLESINAIDLQLTYSF